MKNLYRKIGVVALSGIVISGGILSSEVSIYANNNDSISASSNSNKSVPISWEELGKYGNFICPKLPEVSREFFYIYSPRGVLVKGDDSGIERLYQALENNPFSAVRASGVPGAINESLSDLRSNLDNPDVEKLKMPQLCFRDIDRFNQFMKEVKEKNIEIEEGFYRFMIGGFDGVFYYKSPKKRPMFDDNDISLYYLERWQNKYKYKILKYNFDGDFYYEYDYPIKFDNINDFFNKVHPKVRDKYKAPMVIDVISGRHKEHGGIHEGGIYSGQIGSFVFLFQAL